MRLDGIAGCKESAGLKTGQMNTSVKMMLKIYINTEQHTHTHTQVLLVLLQYEKPITEDNGRQDAAKVKMGVFIYIRTSVPLLMYHYHHVPCR